MKLAIWKFCGVISTILIVVLHMGCASTKITPSVSRESLGEIAVVQVRYAPEVKVGLTQGRGHGAAKGARFWGLITIAGGALSANPYGALLGLALAPISAAGGAIHGAFAADPSGLVQSQIPLVEDVLHVEEIQKLLKQDLTKMLDQKMGCSVIEAEGKGPASQSDPVDYRELEGLDSVLEVGIQKIDFETLAVSNKKVILRVYGGAQVIRVADNQLLFKQEYVSRSKVRDLFKWVEADGCLLRNELEAGIQHIAEQIVNSLFNEGTEPPEIDIGVSTEKPKT